MGPSIDAVNKLAHASIQPLLERCCGAAHWVERMLAQRPFTDWAHVRQTADDIWWDLTSADWRDAFAHHPRIGDLDSLRAKFSTTRTWSESEQSQVQAATESVLQGLARGNREYEAKFGYIFIVCATGKSAAELLSLQALP